MGLIYSYMALSGAIAMDYTKNKLGTEFGNSAHRIHRLDLRSLPRRINSGQSGFPSGLSILFLIFLLSALLFSIGGSLKKEKN